MAAESVISAFKEHFGEGGDVRTYFAPGRVNLIGEHTDYNGGHVFPCALTMGIYSAIRKRDDQTVRLFSENFPEGGVVETSLSDLRPLGDSGWAAYVKGVLWSLGQSGIELPSGFDMAVGGDIPSGSGLSSSAALEVLTAVSVMGIFNIDSLDGPSTALAAQKAENDYVGLKCGIMDQFASVMGKKDYAIFLDTQSLAYKYTPLVLEDACIVVTNTNVKHTLASSAYNDRQQECARALKRFKSILKIDALCDMTVDQFSSYKDMLTDPVLLRRARHAISENQRTMRAVSVLQAGNIPAFGQLMYDSHASLRDDFEVSCPELDLLVDLAKSVPGVIGSRMTGGGFGGCTVTILKDSAVEAYENLVMAEYPAKTGIEPAFYRVSIGGGAREIK